MTESTQTPKKVHLECCICGQYAGSWLQHFNRDQGYGICPECAKEEIQTNTAEYMQIIYGKVNFNYGLETA